MGHSRALTLQPPGLTGLLAPPRYRPPDPSVVAVSALLGQGLEELRAGLEEAVLRATGRQVLTLHITLAGPQLR